MRRPVVVKSAQTGAERLLEPRVLCPRSCRYSASLLLYTLILVVVFMVPTEYHIECPSDPPWTLGMVVNTAGQSGGPDGVARRRFVLNEGLLAT